MKRPNIQLQDGVYRRAKAVAAGFGWTLSQLVDAALRDAIRDEELRAKARKEKP